MAVNAFYREEEPQQKQQKTAADIEVSRIASLKNVNELAGYLQANWKTGGIGRFETESWKVKDAIINRLAALEEGSGKTGRTLTALEAAGETLIGGLEILHQFHSSLTVENAQKLAVRFKKAGETERKWILGGFAKMAVPELEKNYSKAIDPKFMESDAVLSLFKAAVEDSPAILWVFNRTSQIRFDNLFSQAGDSTKTEVVDVFIENLDRNGEHRTTAIQELGIFLEKNQSQQAKDALLGLFKSLDVTKDGETATEVLLSLRPYMKNFGKLDEFANAIGKIVANTTEETQLSFMMQFFNGSYSDEIFAKLSGALVEGVLGKLGEVTSPELRHEYMDFALGAITRGEISEVQKQELLDYFSDYIQKTAKLPLNDRFGKVVEYFWQFTLVKELVARNEDALLEFAEEAIHDPGKIVDQKRLYRFYDDLYDIFFRHTPAFAPEKLARLIETAIAAAGETKSSRQALARQDDNMYGRLFAAFYVELLKYYSGQENYSEKAGGLVSVILGSETRRMITASGDKLGILSGDYSRYGAGYKFFEAARRMGKKPEKTYPQASLVALAEYLATHSAAEDGKLYLEMLGVASSIAPDSKWLESKLAQKGVLEHVLGQFQNETDTRTKEKLCDALLEFPNYLPKLGKIVFAEGAGTGLKAKILEACGKASVQIEDDGRLYKMIGEAKTPPQMRQGILQYIKSTRGQAEAENVALSVFLDERLDYVERLLSIPDATTTARGAIFPGETFALIALDYCVGKLEKGNLGAAEYYVFAHDAALRLKNIGSALARAPDEEGGERQETERKKLREDVAKPMERYLAVVRKDFLGSAERRDLLVDRHTYDLWNGKMDDASDYRSHNYGEPYLKQFANYYGTNTAQEFVAMLRTIGETGMRMDEKTALFLISTMNIFPEKQGRVDAPSELDPYRQEAISLLDALFSAKNFPERYSGDNESMQNVLGRYLAAAGKWKTAVVEDRYDPIKGTVYAVASEEGVAWLKQELAEIGKRLEKGEGAGNWAGYAADIAEILDTDGIQFKLGAGDEAALQKMLAHAIGSQNPAMLENIPNVILKKTASASAAKKKVQETLLAGLGAGSGNFETARMALLSKETFNNANVNKALQQVANRKGEETLSSIRAGAVAALGEHGKIVKDSLYSDDSFNVRSAALGEPLKNQIGTDERKGLKNAERHLKKEVEDFGTLRGTTANSASRAANEENLGKIMKLQENALKNEDFNTDAAKNEYFFSRIQGPILGEFSTVTNTDFAQERIALSSYAGTFKLKHVSEKGYTQIADKKSSLAYMKNITDAGMSQFLFEMGISFEETNTLMAELEGMHVNYVSSSAGIGGSHACGRTDVGEPNVINLDVDEIRELAKRLGLNDKFALYDVTLHEIFHLLEASALLKTGRHRQSELHTYLVGGVPLDEIITEMLSTLFIIQHTQDKANPEAAAHAQEIGADFRQVLDRLNNGYHEITQSDRFVDWFFKVTPTEVFRCYITGDLERLKAKTDAIAPGEFERVFSPGE